MNADRTAISLDQQIQLVAFLLTKQSEQILQEQLGIGLSQLRILRILQSNIAVKQRQVADELGQTEASISRQVKLMLDRGLLHVTINPRNRRERLTQVTSKGVKLTVAALDALAKYHALTFANLTEKQHRQLAGQLDLLRTSLENKT